MNLMICDDQKSELENMGQIVSEYALTHSELSLNVKCFLNPLDMLDEMGKSGVPDIVLLDICMPGILGTEVAREILSKSEGDTDIIFLTTSPDFAVEAFALHAGDYLTKPYTKQRLTDALDRLIEKRRNRLYIPVSCGKEIHRIDLFNVLYAEAKNHSVEIHLKSGKCLKTHTTLTEFKNIFQTANGFVAVGASYIGPEHILMALGMNTDSAAGRLLAGRIVDPRSIPHHSELPKPSGAPHPPAAPTAPAWMKRRRLTPQSPWAFIRRATRFFPTWISNACSSACTRGLP